MSTPRAQVPRGTLPGGVGLGEAGLVAAGGSIGTVARYGLDLVVGPAAGVPVDILAANVSGAFLLGLLIHLLAVHAGPSSRRRRLRLALGTGVLGGYTTYSLLATDVALLLLDGHLLTGLGYGLGSVVLGAVASWAGILTGRAVRTR